MTPFFHNNRNQPAGEAGRMPDDYTIFSESSKLFKFCIILSLSLMISFVDTLSAQKPELPLHVNLKNSSEKMNIRMVSKPRNKTFRIKIGDYTMARAKIKREYTDNDKFLGIPI